MALGQYSDKPKKVYLGIAEGKLFHSQDGKKEYFSYVDGSVERIYKQERNFNGETVLYWYIDLRGSKDELYSISLPYKSGTFKSIVLALASDTAIALSTVKIEPYQKEGFTKVVVSSNGKKLDWVTKQLPEVGEVYIAGQRVKDDTKRMEFIEQLVSTINGRLKK